ncbi:MAG TPA: alpha-glucan family phosphorylase [Syntrophorhabdaceae bacterium]|nr:alpha-glucan family phosphorylase [Syntrophorhabdaceae bacterium]
MPIDPENTIAYFSMEIAVSSDIPTYSGGLGVLAGDTVRSAADLNIPIVAVTLLYRKGYFYQRLDSGGRQIEEPVQWTVENFLHELPERVTVAIEGRSVVLRAWLYEVEGTTGSKVSVYFMDADLPDNSESDRGLTDYLYGGDQRYRLCQEVILGIGGIRMLDALGYSNLRRYHMNEGHAALLTFELLRQASKSAGRSLVTGADVEAVKKKCIFTTHTPVPEGHDKFPMDLVLQVMAQKSEFWDLKDKRVQEILDRILEVPGELQDVKDLLSPDRTVNMTLLALNFSHYVNGVAKKHMEIAHLMFAHYVIHAITNGVHGPTWVSPAFQRLFDRYIPGWRQDMFSLRYALSIPASEVWSTHMEAKTGLIEYIKRETNEAVREDILTIGFARRATTYKRGDLFFSDIERIKSIALNTGPFQLVYAGKAHPQDEGGKAIIERVWHMRNVLSDVCRVIYLPNYDMALAKMLTSGVDVWLNTPQPPLEASGTSGMKAALNGVPSFSILDGWWIEGCIEGVTGWAIDGDQRMSQGGQNSSIDAASLYDKLENIIIPLFYKNRGQFINMMLHCIALNGSFFNTQRMLQQYVLNAYY